jgi:hypothetical protein
VAGLAALEAALGQAETLGEVRPLAFAGPRTQQLLTARAANNGHGPLAARVAAPRAAVLADQSVQLVTRNTPSRDR